MAGRNLPSKTSRHSRESGNPVLIIIAVFLLFFSTHAHADQAQRTKISPEGETTILSQFGHDNVKVLITTHIVDIGKASDPVPPDNQKISSCTYSRIPCSPVDHLRIFVNEKELFVPRSVYMDLADLNQGYLDKSYHKMVLKFEGGDASEGYELQIFFDAKNIVQRKLSSGEFPDNYQITSYHFDTSAN